MILSFTMTDWMKQQEFVVGSPKGTNRKKAEMAWLVWAGLDFISSSFTRLKVDCTIKGRLEKPGEPCAW